MANDPSDARKRLAEVLADIDTMWDSAPLLILSQQRKATIGDLRALLAEASVPAGWKLVPVEPTREMMTAALSGVTLPQSMEVYERALFAISKQYRAMLAAAPDSGHDRSGK